MAHGIVLGDDKQKLSKRLRNYPDPDEMFSVYGADAMRWFLLSSPVMRGGDLVVERKGPAEAVRAVLNPLWNAWKFFALYANADGYQAKWREMPWKCSTATYSPRPACWWKKSTGAMDVTTCMAPVWRSPLFSTPSTTGTSAAVVTGSGAGWDEPGI